MDIQYGTGYTNPPSYMNNIQYRDYIGIYENVYPDGYCNHMIEEFERISWDGITATGVTANRQQTEGCHKHIKEDEFLRGGEL